MALRHIAQKSFVLLRSDLSVDEGLARVDRLKPTHVIVHRTDYSDMYYLFSTYEFQSRLRSSDRQMALYKALDLHEGDRTPTYNPSITIPRDKLASRAIVVENANVEGFIVQTRRVTRGGDIGGKRTTEELTSFYLSANFPSEVRLGDSVSLLVSISSKSTDGKVIPFAVPENTKVDIVVEPKEGFVLEGRAEGSLIATKEETLPLQFKLKATQLSIGKIHIFAFQGGQALGSIRIDASVIPEIEAPAPQRQFYEADVARATAALPDLQLLITEGQTNGMPSLTFKLTATDYALGLNLKPFGPVILQTDPHDYFSKFFAEIESLPVGTGQERLEAERRLASKGSNLFKEVVPQDLQVLLWSLRQRIKSVYIQSEEPWIPWEICRLQGNENGRIQEGKFLCEAFSVTRWIPGKGTWPRLTAKKMGLVVPSDSGLPYAKDEKDYFLSNAPPGCTMDPVPAQLDDVLETLKKGEHDVWHFTGHGGFRDRNPDYSGILLEQGKQLRPEDLSGEVENLGIAHPLVFLNACQVGRSSMSLTDIGGLAKKFVDANAAAFIGAYWSVYDQAAFQFAKELYSRLFAGIPVGRAVQEARLAIKPLGDPTWLAYTVFADPFATIAQ